MNNDNYINTKNIEETPETTAPGAEVTCSCETTCSCDIDFDDIDWGEWDLDECMAIVFQMAHDQFPEASNVTIYVDNEGVRFSPDYELKTVF